MIDIAVYYENISVTRMSSKKTINLTSRNQLGSYINTNGYRFGLVSAFISLYERAEHVVSINDKYISNIRSCEHSIKHYCLAKFGRMKKHRKDLGERYFVRYMRTKDGYTGEPDRDRLYQLAVRFIADHSTHVGSYYYTVSRNNIVFNALNVKDLEANLLEHYINQI